jgi:hypothetical protein
LQGKPYDGHPLGTVIPEIEKQIGVSEAKSRRRRALHV